MNELSVLTTASYSVSDPLYVDDVFSAYLRTGTGADVTVTTGIDMTKGYMLWSKDRSNVTDHAIYDSVRGVTYDLVSNSTAAQTTQATGLKVVSSTGHTVGSLAKMNTSGATYVDWVFRRSPKFFDIVTYTGTSNTNSKTHSLGSLPGMVIIKCTSSATDWFVYHRSIVNEANIGNYRLVLNGTYSYGAFSNSLTLTSSSFSFGGGYETDVILNASGQTYVAYFFAHDPSAEGIIQCGSFTTDASGNATVNLGWEPQYLITKESSTTGNWDMFDSMRGLTVLGTNDALLRANLSGAETNTAQASPTATGFQIENKTPSATFIYLAIRRPNKPPTTGTQVYNAIARTGTGAAATVTGVGFAPDLLLAKARNSGEQHVAYDRLRGGYKELNTAATSAEAAFMNDVFDLTMDGMSVGSGSGGQINSSSATYINHFFKRAVGVFDQVCYTGNNGGTFAHALTVPPELIIVKRRNASQPWCVYHSSEPTKYSVLNSTSASTTSFAHTRFGNGSTTVAPTSSVFTLGWDSDVNTGSATYIAYLFATKAGISKVGSFTGNGTSLNIDMGFSAGCRFFLVKATSTTGSWWIFDSVRGVVSAADPALQLNSTAAEITSVDAVDPYAGGITVNQEATCSINASGVSYIYLSFA